MVDVSPIHITLTSSSTLIEATGKTNEMHDEEHTNNDPMDEDEASEGLPHLQESELPVDGIVQLCILGYSIRRRSEEVSLFLDRMRKKLRK